MRVEEIRKVEDCFDESFIREYQLSEPASAEFILYLGSAGDLQYFPQFARPFYRLRVPGYFIMQGIEGTGKIRIIFERDNLEQGEKTAHGLINSFPKNDHPRTDQPPTSNATFTPSR